MNSASERIAGLGALVHDIVAPLADISNGFALLDFPDYSNVGDSLIWLGELAFFELCGRRPGYVSTVHGFDPAALQHAVPNGPVYLSGGGNFGDLWPRFQHFRHRVLASFPGRRVVQLPQTIHFDSEAALDATREAIRAHGNFKMLVRDEASLRTARERLECDATLCPDMAFCMGPLVASAPSHDILALLRTDKERAAGDAVAIPDGLDLIQTDWIHRPRVSMTTRIWRKAVRTVRPISDYDRFAAIARAERDRGLAILGQGRTIVTDRLHGHIMSILIDRPQVFVDNRYGKVSGFSAVWTHDVAGVRNAASPEQAFGMAQDAVR